MRSEVVIIRNLAVLQYVSDLIDHFFEVGVGHVLEFESHFGPVELVVSVYPVREQRVDFL